MHIAIIGSKRFIHVVRWANALAERGYTITLFSMHEGWELLHSKVRLVELPFINPAGYVLNIPFLRAKIRDLCPDIVHSFYAFGHGYLGRKCSGDIPHVVSVLGSDIFDDVYKKKTFRKIIIRNVLTADAICSTSNIMARQIEKVCERKLDIKITPFGIDTDEFDPGKFPKRKTDLFVIGTVKWLEYKYGIDVLIKAFALFSERHPDIDTRLVIIGSGSKEYEYKRLAKQLSVGEKCLFVGRLSHHRIAEQLSKMDLFAALSRLDSESFGVAVLEASSMELPVVVSNVGGLPEVIKHGREGIVVPKEDFAAASRALEAYYNSVTLREKLGINGRNKVLSEYNWLHSVKIMENIYYQILSDI